MTALLTILSLLATPQDITKEDVKRLVAAGVSDEVIVSVIRSRDPVRPLSADELIELRQAQVGETVLTALLESSSRYLPSVSEESTAVVEYYPYGYYPPPSYFNTWWSFGIWFGGGYPYYPCHWVRCSPSQGHGYRYVLAGTSPAKGWAPVSTTSSRSTVVRPATTTPNSSSGPRSGMRR